MCSMCGTRAVVIGSEESNRVARQTWRRIATGLNRRWPLAVEEDGSERLCAVCLTKRLFPHLSDEAFGWPTSTSYPSTAYFAGLAGTDSHGDPLSPYYALLVMDGDSLGRQLSEHQDRVTEVSQALARFSARVVPIVEGAHQGRVVYAGGDDVLAFLPVDSALRCAQELKCIYEECRPAGLTLTISAAVVYAHMKSPLQAALVSAHRLLDQVAKDAVGRNAFALRVEKGNGAAAVLAKPWTSGDYDWAQEVDKLSRELFAENTNASSSRFLYKVEELLVPFEQNASIALGPEDLVPLLTAEYLGNRELPIPSLVAKDEFRQQIEERMQFLCHVLSWEERKGNTAVTRGLQPRAVEVLRFLGKKGKRW